MQVLIDGYNLGSLQGTGVATDGRCLSPADHDPGHEVTLPGAGRSNRSEEPLLSKVAIFDAFAPRHLRLAGWLKLIPLAATAIHAGRANPCDVQPISEGIQALDADIEFRAHLDARGPRQSGRFSEAAYARRLEALYASLKRGMTGGA